MDITRTQLPSGKYRYTVDGEVHTKASTKIYTHASVYRVEGGLADWEISVGRHVGQLNVYLHTREGLAVKGNLDANMIAKAGKWSRVPGVVEIVEA